MAKKSAEHKAQLGQTAAEKGGHFWKVGFVRGVWGSGDSSSSAWERNTAERFLWQRQGTCGTWRAQLLCAEGRPASCHLQPPQVFQEELTKGMKVGSRQTGQLAFVVLCTSCPAGQVAACRWCVIGPCPVLSWCAV